MKIVIAKVDRSTHHYGPFRTLGVAVNFANDLRKRTGWECGVRPLWAPKSPQFSKITTHQHELEKTPLANDTM